jgi:hypothetical protein
MQDINPTQTYPHRGTAPGSTLSPNDGQDNVQASTVIPAAQDAVDGLAYLAAMILGVSQAPPTTQPAAISGSTYGVRRIRTIPFLNLPSSHEADAGDIVYCPDNGLYRWVPTRSFTADASYVLNDDGGGSAPGQYISALYTFRGTVASGTISGSGGPHSGLAGLDTSGKVYVDELPVIPANAFASSSSGSSWTATVNSMTTVTNLSVASFNCNGNPLVLKVVSDGSNAYPAETSQWEMVASSGGAEAFFQILMDNTTVIWSGRTGVQFSSSLANFSVYRAPPSVVDCVIIDTPPTGVHKFEVQATFVGVDASSLTAINLKFVGYNL